jgi:hypothetical protein
VIIIIVAIAAIFLVLTPGEKDSNGENGNNGGDGGSVVYPGADVTAKELWDDWDTFSGDFEGLDARDYITIQDRIKEIEHIEYIYSYNVNWTIITFQSTDITLRAFYDGDVADKELWGMIIFKGDLSYDYSVGDLVNVEIYISDYEMSGQVAELPEWYIGIMDAYAGDIEYQDINFPGPNKISHAD